MQPPSHKKSTGRSAQVAVGVAFLLVLLAPLVGGIGGGLLVRRWANGPGKL